MGVVTAPVPTGIVRRNDHWGWRGRCFHQDGCGSRANGGGLLHRGDDSRADALLLQSDQVGSLQRLSDSVGTDVVDDQLFVHPGARHCYDVLDAHRSDRHTLPHFGLDHRPVSSLHVVHLRPNRSPGHCTYASSDRCARPRMAHRIPHESAHSSPCKTAKHRPPIRMIGGVTSGHKEKEQAGDSGDGRRESHAVHATLLTGGRQRPSWPLEGYSEPRGDYGHGGPGTSSGKQALAARGGLHERKPAR